jgi:hypothetical protein
MKISPLLPKVALVFAVAYACSDSAAPANSHALLAPKNPTGQFGEPPPPPVDVSILISIESPGTAVFTGVFFSNGELTPDGDPIPTFDGTAWLRLDNRQPDILGFSTAAASANARFMARDDNFSGHGTLFIAGIAYTITTVELFLPESDCGAGENGFPPSPCAVIKFTAEDENGVEHSGEAAAFDRATCLQETKKGDLEFICEPEEIG